QAPAPLGRRFRRRPTRPNADVHGGDAFPSRPGPCRSRSAGPTTDPATTPMSRLRSILSWPGRLAALIVIGLIRVYQWVISPLLGPVCRFEPSCSRYMVEALRKYGFLRGLGKGLWRLARCHPWHPGGYDPP